MPSPSGAGAKERTTPMAIRPLTTLVLATACAFAAPVLAEANPRADAPVILAQSPNYDVPAWQRQPRGGRPYQQPGVYNTPPAYQGGGQYYTYGGPPQPQPRQRWDGGGWDQPQRRAPGWNQGGGWGWGVERQQPVVRQPQWNPDPSVRQYDSGVARPGARCRMEMRPFWSDERGGYIHRETQVCG